MPEWGLTQAQIDAEPWGLPAELLRPFKKITDPIHGDIYLTGLEIAVLDTAPMQRLRQVRQLGTTHLVYPGATHTRFSHALGTLRSAQNLMDVVLRQESGTHPVPDLFQEWRRDRTVDEFDRMVGEATVLARLGGLLHDLGHIPFGHTLEDDLKFFPAHDINEARYNSLWNDIVRELREPSSLAPTGIELAEDLVRQLKPLVLSKSKEEEDVELRYPFVADIVGNTICADLLDYLQRDHLHTGLPAAFGLRFLDGFYVTPSNHRYEAERMVIRIKKHGRLRTDVVSELFKYLRYRYELSERVLAHHAKLAADVMVGKAMEMWKSALAAEVGIEEATKEIERQVLRRGDDGLLEHMLDKAEDHPDDPQWQGVAEIVSQIQRRRLFKRIGSYANRAMANNLYKSFKAAEARAEAEHDAADFAGVESDWMVALWVPDPEMRFKAADVLVDDGTQIEVVALGDWDRDNGQRGSELIESHHGLWAACVYVDQSLSDSKRKAIRERLQKRLGISEWDGQALSSGQGTDKPGPAEEELSGERDTKPVVAKQPLIVSIPRNAIGQLDEWRHTGRVGIEHPDLETSISEAPDSVVIVDDEEFDLGTESAIARINLALFLRELPDDFFNNPDGREQLAGFIRRSPTDFEDRVFAEYATSDAAQRAGELAGNTNLGRLAFEIAAEKNLRLL